MTQQSSMLQRICDAIGFEGTCELAGWMGGRTLYVPDVADQEHVIAKIIGYDASVQLVASFGGETITLPNGDAYFRARRNREVAGLLAEGYSERYVGNRFRITTAQVRNIRTKAERTGILPMILRRRGWPQLAEIEQQDGSQLELGIDDRAGAPPGPLHEGTESPDFQLAAGSENQETPVTTGQTGNSIALETP